MSDDRTGIVRKFLNGPDTKPTTEAGWIEYYRATGGALDGVTIDPKTGVRTMCKDFEPDEDDLRDGRAASKAKYPPKYLP